MMTEEYLRGATDTLCYLSDIFERHSSAFVKRKLLRKKDVKLVVGIIDAFIRRREVILDVGPKRVNLFVRPDRTAEFKEKYNNKTIDPRITDERK